jgi:hypothetical protein
LSIRFSILVLLTAILSSCAPASLPPTPEVKASNPLPEVTSLSFSPLFPDPTSYPQPADTPPPGLISSDLQIIHICPHNPFVPLENLGFPPEMRLVLLPARFKLHTPVEVGFWLMSSRDREPRAITEVAPGAFLTNNEYQVSLDGRCPQPASSGFSRLTLFRADAVCISGAHFKPTPVKNPIFSGV